MIQPVASTDVSKSQNTQIFNTKSQAAAQQAQLISDKPTFDHQTDYAHELVTENVNETQRGTPYSKDWSNGDIRLSILCNEKDEYSNENLSQLDIRDAQNPGEDTVAAGEEDYETEEDLMDKISSSPSIEDEDIDFDFVYALHNFIATIQGQANVTKGDHMTLLDDSNSYWWLVRVVKDNTIGYLPAEHIETPTERLARLNKHRNGDLTSTMLTDQAEKPKKPLKIAFRKKSARTVTFAEPTYVEASEIEYSGNEGDPEFYSHVMNQSVSTEYRSNIDDHDVDGSFDQELHGNQWVPSENYLVSTDIDVNFVTEDSDNVKSNGELLYGRNESKIRNGVLRNTDSFFQDDSVETRKITLTPNLLRDNSSPPAAVIPNEPKEIRRPSLEKPEKNSPDRSRDKKERKDKREKDKKTGKLSGLFKRKDKKNKSIDEEIEELSSTKHTDSPRNSPAPSKDSDEMVSIEEQANILLPETQKVPNKLQKQQIGKRSLSQGMETKGSESNSNSPSEKVQSLSTNLSLRLVQSDSGNFSSTQAQLVSPEMSITPTLKDRKLDNSIKPLGQSHSLERITKEATNSADSRKKSSEIDSTINPPVYTSKTKSHRPSRPEASSNAIEVQRNGSLSQVQTPDTTRAKILHPVLAKDNSSQSEPSSPLSSSSSESIYREDSTQKKDGRRQITALTSKAWSDARLKTFFDDNTDIKDLLIVVYDKSGVVPAGPEHPMIGNLFKEENSKLLEITNRLDGMLGDWLARKTRIRHERGQIL